MLSLPLILTFVAALPQPSPPLAATVTSHLHLTSAASSTQPQPPQLRSPPHQMASSSRAAATASASKMQDVSAAVMSSRAVAAAAADAAVREAIEQRKRSVQLHKFATLLQWSSPTEWISSLSGIFTMLREDAARPQPLHLLCQPSETGELLLTSLLKFLTHDRGEYLKQWCKNISQRMEFAQLCSFIALPPPPQLLQHPEERNALETLFIVGGACKWAIWPLLLALLKRGASSDARERQSQRSALQLFASTASAESN